MTGLLSVQRDPKTWTNVYKTKKFKKIFVPVDNARGIMDA